MEFFYTAVTSRGKRERGVVKADSEKAAARKLKQDSLTVTSIRPKIDAKQYYIRSVSVIEKVTLTKHLAVMLKAGISLNEAIRILELQSKGKLQQILEDIRSHVESGESFSSALARHPRVFNDYYVNMVGAGEQSGNLVKNLELLGTRYAKDYELRRKAQTALVYPGIVISLTIGLGVLIATFVLPRLSGLFSAFQFELPLSTRILLWVADIIERFGWAIAIGSVATLVLLLFFANLKQTKPFFHALYLKIPVLKKVIADVNLARFAIVFQSLLQSGVPILEALKITSSVIGNIQYKKTLTRAVEKVDEGQSLASVLETNPLYPALVTEMVLIGEQTGKLDDVLGYVGVYYENELDNLMKNLSTILEPALLVMIGGVVALIAFSIITPIYNFVGAVN